MSKTVIGVIDDLLQNCDGKNVFGYRKLWFLWHLFEANDTKQTTNSTKPTMPYCASFRLIYDQPVGL